ncbi:unnamed protein product [Mytilus coruscus]|uniref:PHD-type domain-containing protein n=1 Tax=Mytilus coruscus TaxID=42192 RepID=A0A6J8A1F8_MYTCO|nr:unnamed protein product [Mytilus coruscus]
MSTRSRQGMRANRNDISTHNVKYKLDKTKAIKKQKDATERPFNVAVKPATETTDKDGAIVSESVSINDNGNKLFVLNFYNSTSKLLLNGNKDHIKRFINDFLGDILVVLDHNKDFEEVNRMIRKCCEQYLDSNSKLQPPTTNDRTNQEQLTPIRPMEANKKGNSVKQLYNKHPAISDISQPITPLSNTNRYPRCPVCNQPCNDQPNSVACDLCNQWVHYHCEKLTPTEIWDIEQSTEQYVCKVCSTQLANICPNVSSPSEHTIINSNASNTQPEPMISMPTPVISQSVNTPIIQPPLHPTDDNDNPSFVLKEEIKHLQSVVEQRDRTIKSKDNKIIKYESEIVQLKKQLATNRSYTITIEEKNKELQQSLLISSQRIEQLEHETNKTPLSGTTSQSQSSEKNEIKIWFLEQKLRQVELDVHKNNTELLMLKNNSTHKTIGASQKPRKRRRKPNHMHRPNTNKEQQPCTPHGTPTSIIANRFFRQTLTDENSEKRKTSYPKYTSTAYTDKASEHQENNYSEQQSEFKLGESTCNEPSKIPTPGDFPHKFYRASEHQTNSHSEQQSQSKLGKNTCSKPSKILPPTDLPLQPDVSSVCSITAVSLNIEGLTSNKLYLETLANRADFILLQEHWLHNFEKFKLQECLSDFICFTKCFDDNLLTDLSERRRGHAGVSICTHKKLEQFIEPLPDGSNRIVGIRFNVENPIVFLCVYMPCRGNSNTLDDYQQILDELSEIIIKYSGSASIVIGGDMNASTKRNSSQDKAFMTFIKENGMYIPKSCGSDFTFYHYNGRDASEIDYFMQSSDLISTYITFDREPTNSSTHNPILVKIPCEIKLSNQRDGKLYQLRINWNKIDKKGYEEEVESRLSLIDDNELILTCDNISDNINTICKILSESAVKNSSVPINRRKRTGKPRKKPWAPEIAGAAKSSKTHHAKWKAVGKPTNPENEIYQNNKNSKKKLRSLQRRLEATNRNNKYRELMELNERNDKGFYKLVRKQRDPSNPSGSSLIFKDNILNDQIEITEAFAQYFEELSTPCENVNFDNDHFTNVKRDITSLSELFKHSKNHNIPVTTTEEVKKTVLSFKNGKSPDEENITAEHVKFGGQTLISILTNIINFIFQNLDIPSLLKSGIACPILKKKKKKRIQTPTEKLSSLCSLEKLLRSYIFKTTKIQ